MATKTSKRTKRTTRTTKAKARTTSKGRKSSTAKRSTRTTAGRKTTAKAKARKTTTKASKTTARKSSTKKSYTSPFASSFNSAVKRGTPCSTAVSNIAKRTNKSETTIWNSLFKAGLVGRVKFNGQWVWWANNAGKTKAANWKQSQHECWQNFADWCIASGFCTPEQFKKNASSQKNFMNWARKFWAKQFNTSTGSKTSASKKSNSSRRTSSTKGRSTGNYKFSAARKSNTRRTRRAA